MVILDEHMAVDCGVYVVFISVASYEQYVGLSTSQLHELMPTKS